MRGLMLGGLAGLCGALVLTAVTEAAAALSGAQTIVGAATGSEPGAIYAVGLAAQITVGGLVGIPFRWAAL